MADMTEATSTSTSAGDLTAGLFDPAPDAAPDFKKLKKAELVAYYTEHFDEVAKSMQAKGAHALSPEQFAKLKVVQQKQDLKMLFPNPDALDGADVTGFDPSDLIHKTIAEVQTLEDEADFIEQVNGLQDAAEFNFFKLGGLLAEANSRGYMGEYENFFAFVEATFGLAKRKAQVLMQVYHALVACGASWAEAKKVGWAKLMVIATLLDSENYADWFAKAESATFAGLQSAVAEYRESLKNGGDEKAPEAISTPVKKMSFQVHEEQVDTIRAAIDTAKEKAGTEYDGPALEFMALDFMGSAAQDWGKSDADPAKLLGLAFKKLAQDDEGYVTALEAFSEVFDGIDIDVWPDGKPELTGIVANLVEEYGSVEVVEALDEFTE